MSNEVNGSIVETLETQAAEPQVKDVNVKYEDGMLVIAAPIDQLETGERQSTKKGEDGAKVKSNNGVRFAKFVLSNTQKQLLEGAGSLVTNPDGTIDKTKKVSLLVETVRAEDVKAKQEASQMRDFARYLTTAAGQGSKSSAQYKSIVARHELIDLNQLTLWTAPDSKRTIKGHDFASLPEETKTKVYALMGKLGDKAAKSKAEDAKKGTTLVANLVELVTTNALKLSPEDEKLLAAYRAANAPKAPEKVEPASAPAPAASVATPELQTA